MDFIQRIPDMLALLKRLVETESPSSDKAAVDRVGAIIVDECQRLGAQIEVIHNETAGDHIIAHWNQPSSPTLLPKKGEESILLMHHIDTVFPPGTLTKMPFYTKDDKTYGPGVLDMKGGSIITLTAIAALREAGILKRPITALFTSDEEIGSDTSRTHIERLAKESTLVLVLESGMPDGALKVWRKGVGEYEVKVKGRAAHAGGFHQDGRNAIEEMAHQIIAIQKMTDYAKGTTLNVGVIKGGSVSNVVPEEAQIEVDFRVLDPAESDRVDAAMRALKPVLEGTSINVIGGLNRPPMPENALMKSTFARAKEIAATLGMDIHASGTGGGSDGNFVAPLGIPLLDGLGTYGEGLHSDREYIFTKSLPERAALVAELIRQW